MKRHISRITQNQHGFTLIELLVSVSVLVIISGAIYAVFDVSLDVYHSSESRIVMTQKCRAALDRISTDLANMQAIQGDEALVIISQDTPLETGDRDIISFVTLVQTDPDPFLAQLNLDLQQETDEENQPQLVSDVQRVAYYIGPDPNQVENSPFAGTDRSANRGTVLTADEETENAVLLRITTTALDPEAVIQPLLETGSIPETDQDGNPIYADVATVIDHVTGFDLKYFDGEDWYESWDSTDTIPKSIQILITVASENATPRQNITPLTQSTMVFLPMSANFSEQAPGGAQEEAGEGGQAGPGQGGGGGGR
jgi:prepilin-type N-terminal cleavage/methylation domain-containing protein